MKEVEKGGKLKKAWFSSALFNGEEGEEKGMKIGKGKEKQSIGKRNQGRTENENDWGKYWEILMISMSWA